MTLMVLFLAVAAQTGLAGGEVQQEDRAFIPLYTGSAPGSEGWEQSEQENQLVDHRVVRNITRPGLLPFLADSENNTGKAVIVAPGGAFKFLAIDREGTLVARWLRERGINAFVLKYRVDETAASSFGFYWQMARLYIGSLIRGQFLDPAVYPPRPLSDVQTLAIEDALKSIELVRLRASEWGINKDAIGVLGFSAGGAVAHGSALEGVGVSRPDFVASIYGLPAGGAIPDGAPRLFLLTADDDPVVPSIWSQTLHERWLQAGYSSTIHRYKEGGHGFGMRRQELPVDNWIARFYKWLMQEHESYIPFGDHKA